MAQYQAKVKCFVDNSLHEEGEVFEYNGPRNTNLELVQDEVEAKVEPEVEEQPKRRSRRAVQE